MNRPNWKRTLLAVFAAPLIALLPTAIAFAAEAPKLFLATYLYGYPVGLALTVAFLLPWHLWQVRGRGRPAAWRYGLAGVIAAAIPLTTIEFVLIGGEFRGRDLLETFLYACGHGALGGLALFGLAWGFRRRAGSAEG